jgi:hypothetical protein
MSSRLRGSSKTARVLAAIGADMDRLAAATPAGPWREPVTPVYETPDQVRSRILDLIERLNAQNQPWSWNQAAE